MDQDRHLIKAADTFHPLLKVTACDLFTVQLAYPSDLQRALKYDRRRPWQQPTVHSPSHRVHRRCFLMVSSSLRNHNCEISKRKLPRFFQQLFARGNRKRKPG